MMSSEPFDDGVEIVAAELPFVYGVTFRLRGHDKVRHEVVKGSAMFALPSVRAATVPVSMTWNTRERFATRRSAAGRAREDDAPLAAIPFRSFEGRSYAPADPDVPWGLDDLDLDRMPVRRPPLLASALNRDRLEWGFAARDTWERASIRIERETGRAPEAISDSSARRREEAARLYSETILLVDGEVWAATPEPRYVVVDRSREPVDPGVTVATTSWGGAWSRQSVCYAPDRLEDALAHARTLAGPHGAPPRLAGGTVAVLRPDLLATDEAREATSTLADAFALAVRSLDARRGKGAFRRLEHGVTHDGWPLPVTSGFAFLGRAYLAPERERTPRWMADVVSAYEALRASFGSTRGNHREFVKCLMREGERAYARWSTDVAPRRPDVASLVRGADPAPDDEALAVLSMA